MTRWLTRWQTTLSARDLPCDIWLLMAVLALAALGWVMVSSASIGLLESSLYYVYRHGIFLLLTLLATLVVVSLPLEAWRQNAGLLMLATLFLLVLVLFVGQEINGSKRWISLPGPLPGLQVSEFGKLGLVAYLAAFIARFTHELRHRALSVWRPLVVLALPVGLLLAAPDFGGAVVYSVAVIGMLVMAGASMLLLLLIGLLFGGGRCCWWPSSRTAWHAGPAFSIPGQINSPLGISSPRR